MRQIGNPPTDYAHVQRKSFFPSMCVEEDRRHHRVCVLWYSGSPLERQLNNLIKRLNQLVIPGINLYLT